MSAVGTTLLQSPGWNEGKARNGTLGKHRQKRIELRRSGTHSEHLVCGFAVCGFAFVGVVPPLWGSINVFQCFTQGLRPGLCGSIALKGLLADKSNFLSIICRSNHCIYWAVWLFAFVVQIYCSVWLFALVVGFIGWCWRECRRHDTPAKPRV